MKEINLRQWSADDTSYNKQILLSFAQCSKNGTLSLSELLRFTSDAGGEDFAMRDLPWEFLMEKGMVFVVSRVSFHIIKMPESEQQFTLHTWEEKAQGPLFTRRFRITDTLTGEILINGSTIWTLLDFKSRRIIPSKAFTLRPETDLVTEFDGIKPGKIPVPENTEKLGSHKVVFSDMDANGHVNNSKYINFALDNLPEEYQSKTFKDLRLNYSKEATYGEIIDLYGNIDEAAKKITIIGKLADSVCFETELYW